MTFHPAAQILAWSLSVVLLQLLSFKTLLVGCGVTLLAALWLSPHKLAQLLRRTRWIMLSLLLIYAYSTPGESSIGAWGIFSPSREGISDGIVQLLRLLAALAGLAILLDRLHRVQLIAGLYALFAPLQLLGLSRERLAVRLALTLHYAEVVILRETHGWREHLHCIFEPHREIPKPLELTLYRFAIRDGVLVGGVLLLGWMLK